MFYLDKLLNLFKKKPLTSLLLIISLLGVFIFSGLQDNIQKSINKSLESKKEYPYFYALISAKNNAQRVRRQLVKLPGIQEVKFISKNSVSQKVKEILKDINVGENSELFNYEGLKISLSLELPPRGVNLIRDYVKRLVGSEIIIGSLQGVSKKEVKSGLSNFLKNWGWEAILFALSLLSITLFLIIAFDQKREFYLFEEFSRKSKVGVKIYALFITICFAISLISLALFNSVSWYGPVLLFILFQMTNLLNTLQTRWE
ncbi:MAG: hypothetical protein ACO20H_07275 [Bacteriovoracaceae bacterium]